VFSLRFFDEIDWGLLMKAVRRHTDCQWVLLYLERWLRAPVRMPDGDLVEREEPHKGLSSVRCWRISFFIMRSIAGCNESIRTSCSNATLTTVRHDGAKRRLGCNAAKSKQPCSTRDEGRPLGPGLQDQGSNHRKLLRHNGQGSERYGKGGS
jgi:hypothetical protein